ncbi:MAG TPA: serine/threonine-protein kinase, partial [Trebonia sp.]
MEPLSANDPRTAGEFQLRARLGAGGMGRVYLGFSPAGRAVAVKVVHPELARDAEFRRRFAREVATARAVSGMYTAPVVASGLDDDPPWLATAYVPGPSLAEAVAEHGPLAEAAVWRLAAGLTEALQAVHACGLVHRDLKPANVLLAADGPRVIDFGISRALDGTSVTATGMVVGTPGYMSPEQAEGVRTEAPSDVFSLGCVLAYAASGNAP